VCRIDTRYVDTLYCNLTLWATSGSIRTVFFYVHSIIIMCMKFALSLLLVIPFHAVLAIMPVFLERWETSVDCEQ